MSIEINVEDSSLFKIGDEVFIGRKYSWYWKLWYFFFPTWHTYKITAIPSATLMHIKPVKRGE